MTPITFDGYGHAAPDVTIIAENILGWHDVDRYSHAGTKILLVGGVSVHVHQRPSEVERRLLAALAPRETTT